MVIEMGKKYRDAVSGFTGIVTAQISYLHDTPQKQLTPDHLASDGTLIQSQWFDDARLEPVSE